MRPPGCINPPGIWYVEECINPPGICALSECGDRDTIYCVEAWYNCVEAWYNLLRGDCDTFAWRLHFTAGRLETVGINTIRNQIYNLLLRVDFRAGNTISYWYNLLLRVDFKNAPHFLKGPFGCFAFGHHYDPSIYICWKDMRKATLLVGKWCIF